MYHYLPFDTTMVQSKFMISGEQVMVVCITFFKLINNSSRENKENTDYRVWNANTVICLSMCFMCRRHVIMCSSFPFILRHSPFMCGLYTNILRANFIIRTLLPIITCAVFDIYSASVSMCCQNFVICGAFSCYLTFNAALITVRKIMSCGCSLCSKLYDDIPTMRRENRRTQASSLRVAILILCSREEARFPLWPVLSSVLKKVNLGDLIEKFWREKITRVTNISENEMNMFKINAGHYKEQFECSFYARKYWSSCYAPFSVRDLQSKLVVKHINVMSL